MNIVSSLEQHLLILEDLGLIHRRTTHGIWYLLKSIYFHYQKEEMSPSCQLIILSCILYMVLSRIQWTRYQGSISTVCLEMNLVVQMVSSRKINLFSYFLTNGLRQGIHGLNWNMRDQTGHHFPLPSSRCRFQWHHLISLPPAQDRQTVRNLLQS